MVSASAVRHLARVPIPVVVAMTAIEYGLVSAFIAVVVIAVVQIIGTVMIF